MTQLSALAGLNWTSQILNAPSSQVPAQDSSISSLDQIQAPVSVTSQVSDGYTQSTRMADAPNPGNREVQLGDAVPARFTSALSWDYQENTTPEGLVSEFLVDCDDEQIQSALAKSIETNPDAFVCLRDRVQGRAPSTPLLYDLYQASQYSNSFSNGLGCLRHLSLKGGDRYFGQVKAIEVEPLVARPAARNMQEKPSFMSRLRRLVAPLSRSTVPQNQHTEAPLVHKNYRYLPQGIGILTSTCGVQHIGYFDNAGQMNGWGVVVNQRGLLETTFVEHRAGGPLDRIDAASGTASEAVPGTFYFHNGDTFEGVFKGGYGTGPGEYTTNEGLSVKGRFFRGVLQHSPAPIYSKLQNSKPNNQTECNVSEMKSKAMLGAVDGSESNGGGTKQLHLDDYLRLDLNIKPQGKWRFREAADGFVDAIDIMPTRGAVRAVYSPSLHQVRAYAVSEEFSFVSDLPKVPVGINDKKKS